MLAGQPVQKLLPDGTLQAVAPDSLASGDRIHVAQASASASTALCAKADRPSTPR
jgi:hypothetical protein